MSSNTNEEVGSGDAGRTSGGGGNSSPGRDTTSTAADSSTPRPAAQWAQLIELIKSRKIDTALWASRFITIFLCTFYLIPIPIVDNSTSLYYKALMSNAATSALRLHQRTPRVSFTRLFFAQILLEDSCHYLFYSIIFLYCQPIALALVPVYLFAILHFASYALTLLDTVGMNYGLIARGLIQLVEFHTITILRMVAGAEIFTMIFTVLYTVLGRASIITPFIYYRFLTLRYASRRNHYSRLMFYEFRIKLEQLASSNNCPRILGTAIRQFVQLVSRFAPEMVQMQTN